MTTTDLWPAMISAGVAWATAPVADPRETHAETVEGVLRAAFGVMHERGYRVVPVEATREMFAASMRVNHARDDEIYSAMLAAAPTFPPQET